MIGFEAILKLATQRNSQDYPEKPIWGCLLCKKNKPHKHEQLSKTVTHIVPTPSKSRTLALMKDIQRIFFPHYRGRWYTVREVGCEKVP